MNIDRALAAIREKFGTPPSQRSVSPEPRLPNTPHPVRPATAAVDVVFSLDLLRGHKGHLHLKELIYTPWELLTPEQRLERERWRRERVQRAAAARAARAGEVRAAHTRWSSITTRPGVLGKVAVLHSPDRDVEWELVCRGCDPGSYAEDDPAWPCTTALLIADECDVDLSVLKTYREWPPETTDTEGATS